MKFQRFSPMILMSALPLLLPGAGTPPPENLAQRLGRSPDAKLLIVHADDIGMSHSVNRATVAGLEGGLVNSGSIMAPCPWFPEIAAYAREHPEADLGLHLTLTSEWEEYRWDGLLGAALAPGLHDEEGFLHSDSPLVARHAEMDEAEREIRAQVKRAIAFGVRPTHLDSHMGSLFASPELLQVYLSVARDFGIPAMLPRDALEARAPGLLQRLPADTILIDHLVMANPTVPAAGWADFYADALEQLQPGVTEIIVHLGYDDPELRAITEGHPEFGAAWRQRDLDVFTGDRIRNLIERQGIQFVTWREIGRLLRSEDDRAVSPR